MMLMLALCSLVPVYAIGNWDWSSLHINMFVHAAVLWYFEGMAQFFSLVHNPLIGMMLFMNVW